MARRTEPEPDHTTPRPEGWISGRRRPPRRWLSKVFARLNRILDRLPPGRWLHRWAQRRLEFTDVRVTLQRGHADLAGLRIAFLSDIHAGSYMNEKDLCHLFRRVAELEPDIVCLGGDLINTRECEIMMYSAATAPWFRDEPLRRRLLLALPLIDQLYLVNVARFEQGDLGRRERQAHWVGGALVLCGTWVTSQTVAIFFGAGLPESFGLDLAAPLALVGLLAMSVKERPAIAAAAVAGLVAVVGVGLPFRAAVLVAAMSGVVAGLYAGDSPPKEAS